MRNIENNIMKSVKIDRNELLKIVRENKEKHVLEFNEAVEDYKKAAVIVAKHNLKLVNTGELDKIAQVKAFPTKPISYEQSYTRAIRMLELSIEDVIELEDSIFNQLVLDEWNWKSGFTSASLMYKSLSGSI